jgi:hypothetical protein
MIGEQTRQHIARLYPNGNLDMDLTQGQTMMSTLWRCSPTVSYLSGAEFTTLDGKPRNRIGRLSCDTAALQELLVDPSGSSVTWLRSGAGPAVWRVTFESSAQIGWILHPSAPGCAS